MNKRKDIVKNLSRAKKRKLSFCLWHAMDILLKRYNPCQIKDGVCVRGNSCCMACDYLGFYGCTTKCLTCKLWFCDTILNKLDEYPKLFQAISKMCGIIWRYDLSLPHRKPIGKVYKDGK